jgi:O-antigen/teichoic acid export membrane protein
MPDASPESPQSRATAAFLFNVIWGWTGVSANIFVGIFLSPYIIRKLGTERFGIWVLVFSTLDYLRLVDLGFRAAIIYFTARCRARNDTNGANEVINTGLFYLLAGGVLIVLFVAPLAARLPVTFNIRPDLAGESATLILIVVTALAVNLACSAFSAVLEAAQRFDVINQAYIVTLLVRAAGSVLLLANGFGLVSLGWLALATQMLERLWNVASVYAVLPSFRISPRLVRWTVLRQMAAYGLHSFLISTCNMIANQGPTVIIGIVSNPVQVAYFSVAMRLVLYVGEIVPRVGYVTAARTAGIDEAEVSRAIRGIGVYTNRYCLAAFVPLAIFCMLYSADLLRVWINGEFAAGSATVLAVLMTSVVLTMAGQFNSGAILIGQGKHRSYSYALVLESVVLIGGLSIITPSYGIVGAAWFIGLVLLATRGVLPAWLLARANGFSLAWYLETIYVRPLLTALPAAALAFWIKRWLPGRNWPEVLISAASIAGAYYGLALFTCIERRHRLELWRLALPASIATGSAQP